MERDYFENRVEQMGSYPQSVLIKNEKKTGKQQDQRQLSES
jgi:hypothetical protein